jgi:hypothetical protein
LRGERAGWQHPRSGSGGQLASNIRPRPLLRCPSLPDSPCPPASCQEEPAWHFPWLMSNYWPLHCPSSSSCTSRVGIQRRWRVNGLLDAVWLTRALCAAPVSSARCPGRDPVLATTAPGSAAARIPGLAFPWAAPAPLHAFLSAVFASADLLRERRNTEALALRIPALFCGECTRRPTSQKKGGGGATRKTKLLNKYSLP